jgi:hypothetical protein
MGSDRNPGEGSGAAAEVTSRDPGFSEMSQGYFPGGEPAATPEPPGGSEPTPTGETPGAPPPAAAGTPPGEPSAPGAPTATPAPKKWKVLGKEYTLEELEKAGLLDQLDTKFTQAEQVAHFQQLYERERQEREQAARAATTPQQGDEGPSSEQLITFYKPSIDAAVKAGVIEEDVATAYPLTTARLFYLSDLQSEQGKKIAQLIAWASNLARGGQTHQVTSFIKSLTDTVAKEGGPFAPLAQETEAQAFWQWLGNNVNPPVSMLNEDFVKRMWAAYKHQDWIGVAEAAAAAQKAGEEEKRRNAQGEGRGVRPPASEPSKHDRDMAEMSEGYLPGR